ncbi:MAG TPA: DUF839 domain-containing protein [Sandaracinaceae bacterium LLY-WYZ-13_1]|nr:DUF839 domain-containing protein [Sandaracinaceae bacterium LLY-WYZ-13_1]
MSNSEVPLIGGVGAVRFDASGAIVDAYPILSETQINCAGGPTPWHTWLSCEEHASNLVHETDPWGEVGAVTRPALGVFKHEAVAVDFDRWHLYLSEDESDGAFYRFRPAAMNEAGFPDLTAGTLEVAADGAVTWHPVPDPTDEAGTSTRHQVGASTRFDGGEGIRYHDARVYLSTKGDTRVWASKRLLQVTGHDRSEGPAFDPSGTRLYFSSQRGSEGRGVTFEVTGPFHEPA